MFTCINMCGMVKYFRALHSANIRHASPSEVAVLVCIKLRQLMWLIHFTAIWEHAPQQLISRRRWGGGWRWQGRRAGCYTIQAYRHIYDKLTERGHCQHTVQNKQTLKN
jgi:hypothetical protein